MGIEGAMNDDGFVAGWLRVRGAQVNFDLREHTAHLRCVHRKSKCRGEMAVGEAEMTWKQ
jgi:hypothetical protein